MRDIGSEYICNSLNFNENLTHLTLKWNGIKNESGFLSFLLKNNKKLVFLDLESNDLQSKGIENIHEGLEENNSLTELNLSGNNIQDEGLRFLSKALLKNSTLSSLNVSSNTIYELGAEYLAKSLSVNNSLKKIIIKSNQIGSKGKIKLLIEFKTLKIIFSF